MQKIKIKKNVAEQIISKLKPLKNDLKPAENSIFNTDFAENKQNQQVTGKLGATIGQTSDGQIYDLTDPTEKFYYDLKRKFDEAELVEKSSKYIKRWFSNGEWHYKYPPKYKANQNRTETKKDIAQSTKLITGIKPLEAKTEKDIDDAIVQLALYANENELKCAALGNHRIYVTDRTQEHIKETHNEPRTDAEMKHKAKYIPFVPEILKHGKICEKSSSKEGVIYGIIGQVEYFDKKKNKNVIESVELAINYDTDSRKFVFSFADKSIKKSLFNNRDINDTFSVCPIVDTETVPITVYSLSETPVLSSKNVRKSLTISDKLFRLWQRRLSPELQNEMLKLMDNERNYFHLIPKKVYGIEGYPKGQDLENCELMELADTYFIIACGGDWQDEKLVKFEIGNNDKLSASVIKNCEKEDKRVLNKKIAYIINPETINKSLFTDWKVELHYLCDKKGLNYDSIIQKYDDKLTRYVAEEQLHQDAENVIAYKAYKDLNKSLTYSGHKLQGRTRLYGMDISIENKKGSYRSGTDKDGHKWRTLMHYDYGYIRGTEGVDSDQIDVYVGPDKAAQKVYIIHQNDPVTHKYDEDKCMLCFSSAADAKKAYMKQYDRPGFYGSMTTMTIDEFKSFIFSKKGKMIHKSFDIQITDITENNKQQKLEQFNKALNAIAKNQPFVIKHIPADDSPKYENLTVRLMNFDRSKIEKAVHKVALSLDADISGASKGESFVYKAQEELVDKYFKEFTNRTRAVYNFVISYFDLPDIRIVSKAGELRHKGKILYNPETGLPIKESDWKKFVAELEKYLNRNYTGIGEKIVLSAESLGIILDRLSKTNSLEAIRKMSLADLKAKRYDVDWISESVKNMKDKFGDVISRERQARIQIAEDSAAQRVTRVLDDMRNNIQQIIIDGIRDKQSKSVVAQNLFDKCASLNRDMQRIADSEVQMASNSAYCKEEVYNSKPNEKVYFKRFEMNDDNTCKECKKLNGTIVLWSDVPLPEEHIKDPYAKYAIWEGKNEGKCPIGICHPWCRGAWVRYYPELEN